MIRRRSKLVVLVLALALGSPAALGRVAGAVEKTHDAGVALGPLELVQSSVSRVRAINPSRTTGETGSERRAQIRLVADDLFDFDEMTRRALGRHWKDLAPAEQAEVSRLFTDVIERFYVTAVETYADQAVTFQGEKVVGAYAEVQSRMSTAQGLVISLGYHLLERDSRWGVYDVLVDGVSLVANYRSQFDALIRRSSVGQLLERLRADRPPLSSSRGPAESARTRYSPPSPRERLAAGLYVVMNASRRR